MFPKTGFGGNVNAMECDKHSATNGVQKKNSFVQTLLETFPLPTPLLFTDWIS